MINLFSMRPRNCQVSAVSIPIFAVSIFLATLLFIAGCGDEGDTTDTTEGTTGMTDIVQPTTPPPDTGPPPLPEDPGVVEEPGVSFQEDIQPILAAECALAGCHAAPGAAGLDLTNYDSFKKGGNTGPGFDAGDGKGSLVVKRIDGGGMPLGRPPLDGDQIQLFIDWIDEGAENN